MVLEITVNREDVENVRSGVARLRTLLGCRSSLTCFADASGRVAKLDPVQVASVLRVLEQVAAPDGRLVLTRHASEAGQVGSEVDAGDEIRPQEAASILRTSRPTVLRLIGKGLVPARLVGTHHRLSRKQVLAYRDRSAAVRREALDNLVAMTEESDL